MGKDGGEKRERCPNFTFEETELLVSLVDESKEILECKKTDAMCNTTKDVAWEKVTVAYNSKLAEFRTTKMLRSKWDSLKKTSRKEVAAIEQHQRCTGSGAANKIRNSPWTYRIVCMLGVGAVGTISAFDSDHGTNDEEAVIITTVQMHLELEDNVVIEEIAYDSQEVDSDCSKWNPVMLRQPVYEAFQVVVEEGSENTSPPRNVSTPTVDTSVSHQRPLLRKRTNNSPAAETNKKFATLADSKLELIKIQIDLAKKESEARIKMQTEKHEMEMKILPIELQIKEKMLQELEK